MVKGVSKRVVVVKPSDENLFEQAFFIVKNEKDFQAHGELDALQEACYIAERYAFHKKSLSQTLTKQKFFNFACGAAVMGCIWAITVTLF